MAAFSNCRLLIGHNHLKSIDFAHSFPYQYLGEGWWKFTFSFRPVSMNFTFFWTWIFTTIVVFVFIWRSSASSAVNCFGSFIPILTFIIGNLINLRLNFCFKMRQTSVRKIMKIRKYYSRIKNLNLIYVFLAYAYIIIMYSNGIAKNFLIIILFHFFVNLIVGIVFQGLININTGVVVILLLIVTNCQIVVSFGIWRILNDGMLVVVNGFF